MGGKWKQWHILFSWGPKPLWMVTETTILKDTFSWKKSYDKLKQCIKKQRHHFTDKDPYSQSYGNVRTWESDHNEGWVSKYWCFQTVVLEKTPESHLDSKEKPVNPKGNQPWIFVKRTVTEVEAPTLWPPGVINQLIGKDPDTGKD